METLSLVLCVCPLLLALFFYAFKRPDPENLPPGTMGWPLLGESVEFLFGSPEKFVSDRMKKYSPEIFKTRILGEKTAVICGPAGHKFLFSNEQKYFTAFRPHSMQSLFRSYKEPKAPQVQHGRDEEAKVLRSPGFLKPEALVRYLPKMEAITREHIMDHWKGHTEVKAYSLAKTLTLTLACRFFLGIDEPHRIARLVKHFDHVTVGMHCLVVDLPGTTFRQAKKAADAIRRELRVVIGEKRKALAAGAPMQDILTHMVVATDAAGKHMSEAEIADKIMGLLTAGYSTVATAMTFFMKYVGERPDIYEKVLAEQREVAEGKKEGEGLDWEDINGMKYSWNVVNEVMRLTPPLQGTFREALTDVSYGGYTIPKGWKLYWTVSSSNMNPRLFPEPETFNPSRFEEGSPMPAFAWVPFGGGPRMCPGKEYARLAILTFVHNVVCAFSWEVAMPGEAVVGDMMPTPQHGLPIRLRPPPTRSL